VTYKEISMKVQILGSGCPKCKALEANAREAVTELGVQAEVEKVTDIEAIMAMGVMMTPALAIDGEVKSVGRVLTKDQISGFLKGEK
jgi:small redox-active disulfide protein 2